MGKVVIKNISKTCLKEQPLLAVIKKHFKSNKKLEVIFNNKNKDCYGVFETNALKKVHRITISIILHQFEGCDIRKPIDKEYQKYCYISTVLHELRHLQCEEKMGQKYNNKKYSENIKLNNSHARYYFSPREIEARIYEHKHILSAIKIYDEND